MTEDQIAKVSRDLREILEMHERLIVQAISQGDHKLMPGGPARVALGPVANLEAWGWMQDTTERLGRAYTSEPDEDPDDSWTAYQILEFWSEQWRRELGAEYDGYRTNIATEAGFLRRALEWAWDNEVHWDDFASDVRRARVRLEDVLSEGRRMDRSRVECDQCDDSPRLLRLQGSAEDGSEDRWKCPACKHRFAHDDMLRAQAAQLRRESAAKYVEQTDAVGTLKAQGRSERTVRKWLSPLRPKHRCTECGEVWAHQEYPACPRKVAVDEDCGGELETIWVGDREALVEAFCEVGTHRTFVWWPDLWRRHLSTATRQRASA